MTPIGFLHVVAAVVAMIAGALVLLLPGKGGRRHRQLGWTWVVAMLVLNGTALAIYRLFGGFGPFHVMALLSFGTLAVGVTSATRARRHRLHRNPAARSMWVERHYYWMTFSYAGLVAAFASETITRLPATRPAGAPGMSFALAVAGATCLVLVVASRWIRRAAPGVLGAARGRG
jgi:uncharacterized membrane protein